MNTMYRCLIAPVAALLLIVPAQAQIARNFPANALRGEIVVGNPPEITLNGKAARLAPAARIRGQSNMLEMSAALSGARLLVHYTLDNEGLIKDVWILRREELAKTPWPTTPLQAQTWEFDPIAQTWTRR
jgi:hypothetical protein